MSNDKKTTQAASPKNLLDYLITGCGAKNDAAIARDLKVAPPVISKIRHGALPLGNSHILWIHEVYAVPVATIRALAGATSKFQ
jgi:hypothetical protein